LRGCRFSFSIVGCLGDDDIMEYCTLSRNAKLQKGYCRGV
jgi:hypothetical protein